MAYVDNEPGCVKYIRYYNTYLAAIPFFKENIPPKRTIIRQSDRPLRYYGELLQEIVIPNDPIQIQILEENFETSDKAIVDIVFEIEVFPNIDGEIEDIDKCVAAYNNDEAPASWIKNRIMFLVKSLKNESLLSLALADSTAESEVVSKFRFFINELNETTLGGKKVPHLAEMAERIHQRIESIQSGKNLSKKIELQAKKILLEKYNFVVQDDTCTIKVQNLVESEIDQLSASNPGHQPIIEYLNLYNTIQQKLIRQKEEFNEVLIKLETEFSNRKIELELEKEKQDQVFFEQRQTVELEREELIRNKEAQIVEKKNLFEQQEKQMELDHLKELKKMDVELGRVTNNEEIAVAKLNNEKKISLKSLTHENELKEIELDGVQELEKEKFNSTNKLAAEELKHANELEFEKLEGIKKKNSVEVFGVQVEAFEEEVKLIKRKDAALQEKHGIDINALIRSNELEISSIKNAGQLRLEEIQSEIRILNSQRDLPNSLEDVRLSVEELNEIKEAKAKLEIQKIEFSIQEISSDISKFKIDHDKELKLLNHTSEIISHSLNRQLDLDKYNHEILKRNVEMELLLNYMNLEAEEKLQLIDKIGSNLSESLKSANWLNPDLKILASSNSDNLTSGINSFVSDISKLIFQSTPWIEIFGNEAKEVISKAKESFENSGGINKENQEKPESNLEVSSNVSSSLQDSSKEIKDVDAEETNNDPNDLFA